MGAFLGGRAVFFLVRKCIFERRRLKLVAFGLLLYPPSFLIPFLHPFLSSLSLFLFPRALSLSIFHSIHPCSTGMALQEHNHGLCVCVCVCVCVWWDGHVQCWANDTAPQNKKRNTHLFSPIINTYTHALLLHNFVSRNKSLINNLKWLLAISDFSENNTPLFYSMYKKYFLNKIPI